jgi:pyridoxine 5-phosphate synthase
VPERRVELTTEGGLDVRRHARRVGRAIERLRLSKVAVSCFIEPSTVQVKAALDAGASMVEFHTGHYADAVTSSARQARLRSIREAAAFARGRGLIVNAGHGLDYVNVCPVASIPGMNEMNIGYSIICHSVFVGLERAVRQMKDLIFKG